MLNIKCCIQMVVLYVSLLELGNMYGWIELNVLNKIGK